MNLNRMKASIVAAAFAATSSISLAAIDMDATTDQIVKFADELKGTVDGNGRYTLTNDSSALDVVGDALTGTPISSSRYVRYSLANAVFGAVPTLSQATVTAADQSAAGDAITTGAGTASIISGGAAQDNYVVFQITTPAANLVLGTSHATMAAASYDVAATGTATVTYSTHTSAIDATNNANAIESSSQNLTGISSAYSDAIVACSAVATVSSGFTAFAAQAAGSGATVLCPEITADATLAVIGVYDYSEISDGSWVKAAGTAAADADLASNTQKVTVGGNVEFGVFSHGTNATCAADNTDLVANADNTAATSAAAVGTEANVYFCVQLSGLADGETIGKNSYTISLDDDMAAGAAAGSISYDTTTVEAPYVTTYEGYNQRIFIDNRGSVAAYYSTTFTTEDGVTATAGTAATGTLAANTMTTVKVSDLVTFAGGSRGAATMEIEATDANIWVTTQIVDLGTGVTDTLILNN